MSIRTKIQGFFQRQELVSKSWRSWEGGKTPLSFILRKIYEHMGQTINEKSIAVDALSKYELQILYRSDEEPTEAVSPQTLVNHGVPAS